MQEIFQDTPLDNDTYRATFDDLEPLTDYEIEATPIAKDEQVGPIKAKTEPTGIRTNLAS